MVQAAKRDQARKTDNRQEVATKDREEERRVLRQREVCAGCVCVFGKCVALVHTRMCVRVCAGKGWACVCVLRAERC